MTGAAEPGASRRAPLPAGSGSEESAASRRAIAPIPPGAVPVMEAIGVSKGFGATTALVDVSLKAYSGRILALLGDNGAGKSTLIKILSGVFPADRGELRFNGQPVRFANPGEARAKGIATVFQDLAVCELLSVTRNVVLGREPQKGLGPFKWFDLKRADQMATSMIRMFGRHVIGPWAASGQPLDTLPDLLDRIRRTKPLPIVAATAVLGQALDREVRNVLAAAVPKKTR